jgi:serine phosphatase RsbU (regulator of sigma subunit)
MHMQISAANNHVCLIRDNQLVEYKADKVAISASSDHRPHNYSIHEVPLQKGDAVYLFSDGYIDQFGGSKGKKFKYRPFQELLLKLHSRPMNMQRNLFAETIDAWQGELEQIDDILVIGFRI